MTSILCRLFGCRPEPFRGSDWIGDVEVTYAGIRCRRCGWTRAEVTWSGLTGDRELAVRSMLEQLEAKIEAEGGSVSWHSRDVDAD